MKPARARTAAVPRPRSPPRSSEPTKASYRGGATSESPEAALATDDEE